ncbi:MAG TPA: hypothetical protein P5123_07785 [Spirochaetota bacterium]|nr:hypothetical protein [Spirochaetota bacterium]
MKKALITILLLSSCSYFMVRSNNYYTKDEAKILEQSSNHLGMSFGYDSRIDLNYFYKMKYGSEKIGVFNRGLSATKDNTQGKPEETPDAQPNIEAFRKSLSQYTVQEQFYLLVKVYYLYERTLYYKKVMSMQKKWRDFNTVNLEYLPATELYFTEFENYFKETQPKLYSDFLAQKNDLKVDAITELQKENTVVDEY